jgi:hypothetical protein
LPKTGIGLRPAGVGGRLWLVLIVVHGLSQVHSETMKEYALWYHVGCDSWSAANRCGFAPAAVSTPRLGVIGTQDVVSSIPKR